MRESLRNSQRTSPRLKSLKPQKLAVKLILVVSVLAGLQLAPGGLGPFVGVAFASDAAPLITQPLVPASTGAGGPSFTLTVNGTGFASGAVVNWNGSPRATTVVSSNQVTATITAVDIAKESTGAVTVANPTPGSAASNVVYFSVTNPTSSVSFTATTGPLFGIEPVSIATGDFNGDGIPDLAAVDNSGGRNVYVFLGDGHGTFTFESSSPVGVGDAEPIVVADFNADGKLDLAVLNENDETVTILLGNGDGTFSFASLPAAGPNPVAMVAADFNGDGNPDLAIVTESAFTRGYSLMTILLGNGDGTFTASAAPPAITCDGTTAVVGDFNGDGIPDMAVLYSTGECSSSGGYDSVQTLLGNGNGTFTSIFGAPQLTGKQSSWLLAADFNGDGKLDLITLNPEDQTTTTLLGNGGGTFTLGSSTSIGATGVAGFAMGDFNGDGKLDLAVGSADTPDVSILLGNGGGTFTDSATTHLSCGGVGAMAVADFNADGKLDFASPSCQSGGSLSIALQDNAETSFSPTSLSFGNQVINTTSATKNVTLTSSGSTVLNISSVTVTGANAGDFVQTNQCPSTLAPRSNCTITVTYKPTILGRETASITVTDNAADSPETVALSGTGVEPAVVSPKSLTFPPQAVGTTSAARNVTLVNNQSTPLTISSLTFSGADPGDFNPTSGCGTKLRARSRCTISVTFTPSARGFRTATLNVNDSASGSPQTVSLTGTGK